MRTLVAIIGFLLALSITAPGAQSGAALLEQAMARERSGGGARAQEAIQLYERVLKEFASDRPSVARAKLQLGLLYDKLGQEEKAQQYYDEVVNRYPDQAGVAAQARVHWRAPAPDAAGAGSVKLEFGLGEGQQLAHAYRHGVDISPDGKLIAFAASTTASTTGADPNRQIYLRSTEQFGKPRLLSGTETGYNPFFSQDGQWIGFFTGAIGVTPTARIMEVRKVSVSGGPPVVVFRENVPANVLPTNMGAAWGGNGEIVLGGRGGLRRIPEGGGAPQPLTEVDPATAESDHRLPHFLPDASGVLFTVTRYSTAIPDFKFAQIWVHSLKTGTRKLLIENATDARYAGNNRLMFARDGQLFAVPFDLTTHTVTGPEVAVADGDGVTHLVRTTTNGLRSGAAQYSVSQNGFLVYVPGTVEPANRYDIVHVDPRRNVTALELEPRSYFFVQVSPDGKYLLLGDEWDTVWVYDLTNKKLIRQIPDSGKTNVNGDWSPDGLRFAFTSLREGPRRIYLKALDSPDITPLLSNYMSPAWTPDGKYLAVVNGAEVARRFGIYLVPLDNPNDIRPFLQAQTHNILYPAFSPDGQWLAYGSDESGSYQVYVQPFPGPGPRVQVSRDTDSRAPVWSQNGQELFYTARGSMMSVRFSVSEGEFVPQPPTTLFTGRFVSNAVGRNWDVAPGGDFFMIQAAPPADLQARNQAIFPSKIRLVLNWTASSTLAAVSFSSDAGAQPGARGPSPGAKALAAMDREGREAFLAQLSDANRKVFGPAVESGNAVAIQSAINSLSDLQPIRAGMAAVATRPNADSPDLLSRDMIVEALLTLSPEQRAAFLGQLNDVDRRALQPGLTPPGNALDLRTALQNVNDRASFVRALTTALSDTVLTNRVALPPLGPAPRGPGITGRWQVTDVPNGPWIFDLEANGTSLSGSILQPVSVPIYDGMIDGNILMFKVKSPDGDRTIMFTGHVDEAGISFWRDVQTREGGQAVSIAIAGPLGVGDLPGPIVAGRAP
ncbi:MAG TPA: tetratricopeptide repeat protein [Terriglobia bacterium]|nr:tetratricopeptide repeat protein [Terriglobia bacterium]